MGQYHILVNFTKREFVNPHSLGNGAKLWENIGFETSLSSALFMLMAVSNNRGGGDFRREDEANRTAKKRKVIGSWGGDCVAVIGDYYAEGDVVNPPNIPADLGTEIDSAGKEYKRDLYRYVRDNFKDISGDIRRLFALEFEAKYKKETYKVKRLDGTIESHDTWNQIEEDEEGKPLHPDMVVMTERKP